VTPLGGAFVAIVLKGTTTAIYAKTTARGELLSIEKSALDADPPNDNRHWVFLDSGQTYECFWSYDKALFATAIKDIDARVFSAAREYAFFEFTTNQARIDRDVLDDFFPSWDGPGSPDAQTHNRMKLAALLHHVGPKGSGYFSHTGIAGMNVTGEGGAQVSAPLFHGPMAIGCWIFARRPAICTTYLAEFVTHYVAREKANSLWHFDQLQSVMAVVKAGKNAERLEALDAPLFGAPKTDEHPAFEGLHDNAILYWKYAHDCGVAHVGGQYVDGGTFESTLYDFTTYGRPPDSSWYQAAQKIKAGFGVPHPSRGDMSDNDDFRQVPPAVVKSIVGYFDFYQYSVQQNDPSSPHYHHGWMAHVPDAQGRIQQIVERVSGDLRVYFRSHGDCLSTWADIGWHVEGKDPKRQMNLRFLEAAEDVGYDWWEAFPTASPGSAAEAEAGDEDEGPETEPDGVEPPDEVAALMKVIQAGWVEGTKQADLFEHFFAWRSRTMAARITAGVNRFKGLNRRIKCIETWLVQGRGLKTIQEGDITLETRLQLQRVKGNVPKAERYVAPNPKGTITVKQGDEVVGELDIELRDFEGKKVHLGNKQIDVIEPQPKPGAAPQVEEAFETLEVDWGHYPKGFRRLSGGKSSMKVPFWASGIAYLFIIGSEVHELYGQFKKHNVKGALVAELGVNLGLEVWTLGEAMELSFLKVAEHKGWKKTVNFIEGWGKFGKLAMGGAVVVEAILLEREGALILLEEVPLVADTGKRTRATLLTVKGCVLLGGAAGSVAAMALVSVATGGLVLAAVAMGAAVIDVAIWIWGERATAMEEADERLVKALASEFGTDYAPRSGSQRYVVCRTYDHLAELSADLDRLAVTLGDMDRIAAERRRQQKQKKQHAAEQAGAAG
jgi:hypothetical protein